MQNKTNEVAADSSLPAGTVGSNAVAPAVSLVTFTGRCDGSAAAPVSAGRYLVTASDETDEATEENTLGVYDPRKGGAPVATLALNNALGVPEKGKRSKKEADLESATVLNGRIFWIASHSLSKDAEERTARYQFFATKETGTDGTLQVSGKPYHSLKRDILADKALSPFLGSAATRNPEEPGGWNIEGMAATPDGTILIAFRNPILDGKSALMVPLLNPEAIIDDGATAKFGAVIKLDLSGGDATVGAERGIRDIAWWAERERYVILAGSYLPKESSKSGFQLLLWDGKNKAVPVSPRIDLSALHNPEAVFIQPGDDKQVMILSDDGSVDGCKEKPDNERRFNGIWVPVPR